jgi:hypothetical protein
MFILSDYICALDFAKKKTKKKKQLISNETVFITGKIYEFQLYLDVKL